MKISFFPFTPEVETIARHAVMMGSYTIEYIISFREDELRMSDFSKRTAIPCTTSVEEGLQSADALILLDNLFGFKWDKYERCIEQAAKQAVPVYASRNLIDRLPKREHAELLRVMENKHTLRFDYQDNRLLEITTPIIAVLGLGESSGKFECQLELKQYIENAGYSLTCISSNPLGAGAGMKTMPAFMFEDNMAYQQKVLLLNRYVYDLCATENPDLLVLGVPGGIAPISQKNTNYFSEIPLVVSSALHVDSAILTLFYEREIKRGYLNSIQEYCRGRYFLPIDAFYMSRQMAMYNASKFDIEFLYLSDEYLRQHETNGDDLRDVAVPLSDHASIYESILNSLQKNLETV